jgi:CBS domain containing-hemolysin-like protein
MTVLLLIALLVLVFVNGFFVAAEFSLVRSRRARLEELAADDARYRRVVKQHDDIAEYLSACQFGITLASLGIGFLGEPALAKLVEPAFGGLSHAVATTLAFAIAYAISTSLHITLGEQVPKIYAIVKAERVARSVARPLDWFNTAMRPFIALLNGAANSILRLIRIDPEAEFEEGQSPEELRFLIARAQTGGHLEENEAGMLQGVFHLHEQEARQVMTPIPAVVTVDISEDVETALRRCISSGHTRLVVTEDENQDRVRGTVHANSLARQFMTEGPGAPIEGLVKEGLIVPETKPLDDLLADLQRQRSSMAVVVDEYGRVAGIVTVEDIVEEVVGEIDDETDPAGGEIRRLANGDWFVRGHVAVSDLLDHGVHLPVDTDAYNSVGGFVFAELGRLPKRGDSVTADGYSIRVESVRENRIEAVRIRERRAPAPAPAAVAD